MLSAIGPFRARGHLLRSWAAALVGGVALATALGVRLGASALTPAFVLFGLSGAAMGVYDIRRRKVPNWMLMPTSMAVGGLLLIGSAVDERWSSMLRACGAAVALSFAFGALAIVFRRGLGFGDVKLAGLVGLIAGYVSWHAMFLSVVLAFVGAAILGLGLFIRQTGRGASIPFAPFLVVGAVVAICVAT